MPTTTKRHLPVDAKAASAAIDALTPALYDLLEFTTHVKQAHWNLRDANFIAVHRLLDDLGAVVSEATDEVAERIRQLGSPVDGRSSVFSKENSLPNFPTGELNADKAISHVCESLQTLIGTMRNGIEATEDEPITADLLTAHTRALELQLWLLDSHLA